jgi:uncharacterized protein (TIGR02284 family)
MEDVKIRLIDDLNHLVTVCDDGKYGYRAAAEEADSALLRSMFSGYSAERAEFCDQLKSEIIRLGGDADHRGNPLTAINRAWIDVKKALSSRDNKAVLGACITGERAAIKAYSRVLQNNQLPAETRALLNQQRRSIEETLNKVEGAHETIVP